MHIRKVVGGWLVLIGTVFSLVGPARAGAFIVEDGQPRAQIVIADEPTRMQQLAAMELQHYIQKITGALLPVVTEPTDELPVRVYVGRSPATDRIGVTSDGLQPDDYRMVAGDRWLVLIGDDTDFVPAEPYAHKRNDRGRAQAEWDEMTGNRWRCPGSSTFKSYNDKLQVWFGDGRGSLNAVYDFLRSLGVRWYFPGDFGECLTKTPTIPLPDLNQTVQADFVNRQIGFSRYYFGNCDRERALWYLRLGLRAERGIATHGIDYVIHHASTRTNHPEYYMLVNGERDTVSRGGKPCLSSPGLLQSNIEFARTYLDVYDARMVNVMPTDGYVTLCQCELCAGKSTPERGYSGLLSDYVWGYANAVAREVYKTHPDKLISCGSYTAFKLPPLNIDKLSPNMVVRIKRNCAVEHDAQIRQNALDLRRAWMEKLSGQKPIRMGDNYTRAAAGGLPVFYPHLIAEDTRSLKNVCQSEYIEINAPSPRDSDPPINLAVNHLNIYVKSRMWWDADQDVDALLAEYYEQYYGPAAAAMQTFIEYSETNWWKMPKEPEPIYKALELLAAARQAAGADNIYAQRIGLIAEYLHPLEQLAEKAAIGRKDVPQARVYDRRGRQIVIDGKADDEFWAGGMTPGLREIETGEKPKHKTSFKSAWKDGNLYFFIHCQDDDMQNLNIGTTENESMDIWNGDVVEILLETQNHAYYQIAINPAGAIFDADRKHGIQTLWNSEAEAAIFKGDDYWNIEIRIPIADEMQEENLPNQMVSGRRPNMIHPWYFNIGRKRVREDSVERSMFSPTGAKSFHVQEKFGKLYMEK